MDIGIYLQTLMRVLVEHGLACCPQGALALSPDEVHKIAILPEGNASICGLAFGYEDSGGRIKDVIMDRAPLAETVEFIS
mgnify:CR=1 FL=1